MRVKQRAMVNSYSHQKRPVTSPTTYLFYTILGCFSFLMLATVTYMAVRLHGNSMNNYPGNEVTVSGGIDTAATTFSEGSATLATLPDLDGIPVFVPKLPQASKFAYVTLISGIDTSFRYRGFLYNTLIMRRALKEKGSVADFIALIGFRQNETRPFTSDLQLLEDSGVRVFLLPRLLSATLPLSFAEMALLKITPWSFTEYERIQFFDGDVMPTRNMDCFFKLQANTFTLGAVSPLNSGWYLAIPDMEAFNYMREKAIWRLKRDWDKIKGWKEKMPKVLTFRGGKPCTKWDFNGADMDQGLLTHYFVINFGKAILIDTTLKVAKTFEKGLSVKRPKQVSMKAATACCSEGGGNPLNYFAHFTGKAKPWMQDLSSIERTPKTEALLTWAAHLDSLKLPVNSKTLKSLGLGSPLGFFNAKFPKGGYKEVV